MRNSLFLLLISLTMFSCSNEIDLVPIENSSRDSTINFNFKAIPDNDYYRANENGVYTADIELYLRPFQEIISKTPLKFVFKSDNFGVFVIKKDTLYPDDQTQLSYSDFRNFRQYGQFYTNHFGKQSLSFELEISKSKQSAKAVFETK